VLRGVSGSSQRNQMFRVSLQVFAVQHRVEWEADLTSEVPLALPDSESPRVYAFEDGEAAWRACFFPESQLRMKP